MASNLSKHVNIVIPMAGRGSRFTSEGYSTPKPFLPIHGKTMIEVVVHNVTPKRRPYTLIFLVLQEHIDSYGVDTKLQKQFPGSIVVPVTSVTEGAACTVLLAKQYINNDQQLMTVNSDQWVDTDIDDYLDLMDSSRVDGLIMTLNSRDPKWSFVSFNRDGSVCGVFEKIPVSNEATVGIYNFAKGSDFVFFAERMISKNLRVNGEFYVAPVYNEFIVEGRKLIVYNIGSDQHGMYGLGTPSDYEFFLSLPISKKAVNF